MKVCVAQIESFKGNLERNIDHHVSVIKQALKYQIDLIVFPELSLTNYEPTLAAELATHQGDPRFKILQELSDANHVIIGAGMPLRTQGGTTISMMLFHPAKPQSLYSKKYLHADEEPFFVSGDNFSVFKVKDLSVALAICYEISIDQHVRDAQASGAEIYVASVVKSVRGAEKALMTLAETARRLKVPVLMSNSVGVADGDRCAGRSTVWNDEGKVLAQLGEKEQGFIVYDTQTKKVITSLLPITPV
jgi:predicted amidohydrolase